MYSAQTTWTPLLRGADRLRAEEIVASVAAEIESQLADLCAPEADGGVAGGSAGVGLAAGYIWRWRPELIGEQTVAALMAHALNAESSRRVWPSLYFGALGAHWTAEHLRKLSLASITEAECNEFDGAIEQLIGRDALRWKYRHELFRGLVGIGLYLLERPQTPTRRRLLDRLVETLIECAEWVSDDRLSWKCDPEHIGNPCVADARSPYFSLSIPHGAVAPIALLAAVTRGPSTHLDAAIDWLFAQQHAHSFPRYGFVAALAPDARASRPAWCYGDLGIAAVLASCGVTTGVATQIDFARTLGLGAAGSTEQAVAEIGTSLCHGAAGNAHMFARLYQTTAEVQFERAALQSYRDLMDSWSPGGSGFGGFTVQGKTPQSSAGFLRGAAGSALALLAAVSSSEPSWDRLLLLSSAQPEHA